MRLEYIPDPPQNLPVEDQQICDRIRARRGPAGLLGIDRTLLHAPKVADGWDSLLGAIRTQTSLPEDIREIAICRACLLNTAWTEWKPHEDILQNIDGMTEAMIDVVKMRNPTNKGPLSDRQWAVLEYADAMTTNVQVPERLVDRLKNVGFCAQEIVEITATVAAYNFVCRFVLALDVSEGIEAAPGWFNGSEGV
ncbi:AhpD-like protein [Aspergillus keveii]|uniref:AhpD-like protein n=1 Tax=Aspergillus keveii TaxID=714993 RepID=A0ABR4FRR4_9EURO